MKLIQNILYIEFKDLREAGWKEDTIKKANFRNGPFWQMIANPADKRMPLVKFETLREKDQEKIIAHFGDPFEFMAKQPIKDLVQPDPAAETFYKNYRYSDNKHLPVEHREKYTTAAAWLNMLIKVKDDRDIIKKVLKITLDRFWGSVGEIITAHSIELPASTRRLWETIKAYQEEGYACIIDKRFGNKNSAKVGKSEEGFDQKLYDHQLACIRSAASKPNHFDAAQISREVNKLFELKGWPTVSDKTVLNIINANRHLTTAGNHGKRTYMNEVARQHKRSRPVFPLQFIVLDGWTVELLYQENGKYHHRLTLVVVLDTMNNYPIGYAIGDREDMELIRQANRNASYHINELFGAPYQPGQLQCDHYGLKGLTPFYQAMSRLVTPAAVGNAKAKVIEPYFKDLNKNYCQYFPNWSGFNLNSKKSNQPNTEFLDKTKHSLPNKEEVIRQIHYIMAEERKAKIEQYQTAWQLAPDSHKVEMNKMDLLMVHGVPTGRTVTCGGQGLTITLNGERHTYDSFEEGFRDRMHLPWSIAIIEDDLSCILAYNEAENRRFVLEKTRILPMDVHSMEPEDHAYSSRINAFNKDRMQTVIKTYAHDSELVEEALSDLPMQITNHNEAKLKLMFTHRGQQKETLQDAKGLKRSAPAVTDAQTDFKKAQLQYMKDKIDFSQYED